jgi:hypothetical protein
MMIDARAQPANSDVNASWRATALLHLATLSTRFRLLHIPKNGGSTLEQLDSYPPKSVMAAYTSVWTSAVLPERSPVERSHLFMGFRTCRACAGRQLCHTGPATWLYSLYHMTPEHLAACDILPPWNPYAEAELVYCVLRAPLERFVSDFLYARATKGLWPEKQCGPVGTRLERRQCGTQCIVAQLGCYAEAAASAMRRFDAQWARVHSWLRNRTAHHRPHRSLHFDELTVHTQPQSNYLADGMGRPTCDVVFSMDDLQRAQPPRVRAGSQPHAQALREHLQAPRIDMT